jgi:hypothetical protein
VRLIEKQCFWLSDWLTLFSRLAPVKRSITLTTASVSDLPVK